MAGYNKTIIIGRLGKDPELNRKGDMALFNLCNTFVNQDKPEAVNVQWYQVAAKGKQAELAMKYFAKGDLCCIEGKWDMKRIIAERIVFLSNKKNNQEACNG